MKLSYPLLIIAIIGGLTAGSAWAGSGGAPRSGANGRLVIHRAANFGNQEHFNLYIDGRRVANLGINRHYEALLPAGDYVLRMEQMPHLNDAYPYSEQRIRVAPGRTSAFTAFWRDGGTRIVLDQS